jgi:hypothetical protein
MMMTSLYAQKYWLLEQEERDIASGATSGILKKCINERLKGFEQNSNEVCKTCLSMCVKGFIQFDWSIAQKKYFPFFILQTDIFILMLHALLMCPSQINMSGSHM